MLSKLSLNIDMQIQNTDLLKVDQRWNWKRVNSPFTRLYCVTGGNASLVIGEEKYELLPGYMYLIPCFLFHDYNCADWMEHYFIHFTAKLNSGMDIFNIQKYDCMIKAQSSHLALFKRLLELNPDKQLENLNPLAQSDRRENADNIPLAALIKQQSAAGEQMARVIESHGILHQLMASFLKTAHRGKEVGRLVAITRFEEVLSFLDENIAESISLEEMASVAHLNPTYFSNLFDKLMGERPTAYLNRKRIEKAQLMLVSTDKNLREISYEVGFADENYFSRIFKKHIGVPPARYRNLQLG